MAQKKSTPLPVPPSESEEDYTDEEEEEESSSTEDENGDTAQTNNPSQPPSRPPLQHPKPPANNQESGEESESESESDSEEIAVPPTISKPNPIPSLAKNSKAKRVADEEPTGKNAKRVKGKTLDFEPGEKSEDVKKNLFQRLWSEEDEVALLEGACTFGEKTGTSFVKEMATFYEFIKNDMHFDVSLNQMKDKFWRMKKRFENGVRTGDKKTFTNEHYRKIFELSKKLWKGTAESPNTNGKAKVFKGGKSDSKNLKISLEDAKKKLDEGELNVDRFTPSEKWILKKGRELLDEKKKRKINDQLKNLEAEELELYLKRSEIVRDCAKSLLTASANSKRSDDEEEDT